MSRKLSHSSRYPFESELLYSTFATQNFWESAVTEFLSFTEQSSLEDFSVSETGIDVTMKQTLPYEYLPPIAQAVLKFDLVITRKDFIGPYHPETTEGTFTATIPASPGWLRGTQTLTATPAGCTLRKTAEVKVYIPFVGGKLEQLVLVNLVELAKAEAEFTTTYIYKSLGLDPNDYPESYGERSIFYTPERLLEKRNI